MAHKAHHCNDWLILQFNDQGFKGRSFKKHNLWGADRRLSGTYERKIRKMSGDRWLIFSERIRLAFWHVANVSAKTRSCGRYNLLQSVSSFTNYSTQNSTNLTRFLTYVKSFTIEQNRRYQFNASVFEVSSYLLTIWTVTVNAIPSINRTKDT